MAGHELVIGVATTVRPKPVKREASVVQRPPLFYCHMAEQLDQLGAQMVLFSPADIHTASKKIDGWSPAVATQPFGNWVRVVSGYPKAVYENVFVHLAVQGFSQPLRSAMKKENIPLFNPPLPSKWVMSRWMDQVGLGAYQPVTYRLGLLKDALGCIDEWKTTFVKPIGGYGGMGVARVQRVSQDRYRVSIDRGRKQGGRLRRFMTRQELSKWLGQRQRTPHLIQKGIDLIRVDGRTVDFRVVVQRTKGGAWKTVGVIPKQARPDGVVSNIIAGGERLTVSQLVAKAASTGIRLDLQKLEDTALQIAEKLGRRYPHCGLLGFDMGMTPTGAVQMIEMNPKPARSLLSSEMRARSARYAAEFAVYLAGGEIRPEMTGPPRKRPVPRRMYAPSGNGLRTVAFVRVNR